MTAMNGIGAALLVAMLSQPALAHPSTNLKIMIFPLECSIDLLNTGVTTFRQITPENCQDPEEEPGIPGSTGGVAEQTTSSPRPNIFWHGGMTSPLEQEAVTAFPESPEVRKTVVSEGSHDHRVENVAPSAQVQIMTAIITLAPLLALLYGLIHFFTGKIGKR